MNSQGCGKSGRGRGRPRGSKSNTVTRDTSSARTRDVTLSDKTKVKNKKDGGSRHSNQVKTAQAKLTKKLKTLNSFGSKEGDTHGITAVC